MDSGFRIHRNTGLCDLGSGPATYGLEISMTRHARTVRIDQVMLLEYEWPILALRITCGRGTYIRSIARDLGRALDTGGHLAALRRTAVGPYDLSTAFTWQRLDAPIGADDLIDSIGP